MLLKKNNTTLICLDLSLNFEKVILPYLRKQKEL